jgi:hypothetical protein
LSSSKHKNQGDGLGLFERKRVLGMVLLAHKLILMDEQPDIFWSIGTAQNGDMM